ncbi:MAG: hypothetical protein ABI779_05200 [Acidobacteriota bacterium]
MKAVAYLMNGVVAGVLGTVVAYAVAHRNTVVYEATHDVESDGILIPKGTNLIHDATMSEGFDTLKLYINGRPDHAGDAFQANHRRETNARHSVLG